MSTFKKAKIIMLPTNQKTKYLMVYSDVEKTKGKLILNGLKNDEYKEYQHLYIISYIEKPDNGDYYIIDDVPELLKNNGLVFIDDSCRKVIATTNKTLSQTSRTEIPQPSEQFIQKYIEEYNRGNIITDVLVEYELISNEEYFLNTINPDENVPYFDEDLKINPKYNTITIKKAKDSYTREEVDRMLDEQASRTTAEMMEKFKDCKSKEEVVKIAMDCMMYGYNGLPNNLTPMQGMNKWIEENL